MDDDEHKMITIWDSPIEPEELKRLKKRLEDILDLCDLTQGGAQMILKDSVRGLEYRFKKFIKEESCDNLYFDPINVIASHAEYSEEYRVKSVRDQIIAIQKVFPDVKIDGILQELAIFDKDYLNASLPKRADGWFVFINPAWLLEQGHKPFDMIKKGLSYIGLGLNNGNLMRNADFNKSSYGEAPDNLKHSMLYVLPAQFGKQHKGWSLKRSRAMISFNKDEFTLSLYETLFMVITHPERFANTSALKAVWSSTKDKHESLLFYRKGKEIMVSIPGSHSQSEYGVVTGFTV